MIDEFIQGLAAELDIDSVVLQSEVKPFVVREPIAVDGSIALVYAESGGLDGEPVVIKLPRKGFDPYSTFKDRVDALQSEADVLGKCRGARHVVQVVADRSHNDAVQHLVLERLGPSLSERIEQATGRDRGRTLPDSVLGGGEGRGHGTGGDAPGGGVSLRRQAGQRSFPPGRGWVLIGPSPREFGTEEYQDAKVPAGPQRDIVALGRTFLATYLGEEGLSEIPEGYDLREEEELRDIARFLCWLLSRGFTKRAPKPVPDAGWVYREANRLLKAYGRL